MCKSAMWRSDDVDQCEKWQCLICYGAKSAGGTIANTRLGTPPFHHVGSKFRAVIFSSTKEIPKRWPQLIGCGQCPRRLEKLASDGNLEHLGLFQNT